MCSDADDATSGNGSNTSSGGGGDSGNVLGGGFVGRDGAWGVHE